MHRCRDNAGPRSVHTVVAEYLGQVRPDDIVWLGEYPGPLCQFCERHLPSPGPRRALATDHRQPFLEQCLNVQVVVDLGHYPAKQEIKLALTQLLKVEVR